MSEQKKELRQAENKVKIEGIVSDIRFEVKEINGKDAISGEIDILVNEDTHTVNVFSYKTKENGEESSIYKGLVTVMNEYKSIKEHGEDQADKVRITQGQIGLNEYYAPDGALRSFPKISTSFINRIQSNDQFKPEASFTLEMVVDKVVEETKNDEATGRAIIKGIVPAYGGKVFPFDVVVGDPKAVNYVTTHYEKGKTVTVFGDIVNKTIITEKVIEAEFGEDKIETVRTTIREYAVKGGTAPRDEDNEGSKAFKVEDIKKALKEREEYLEELKKKSEEKKKGSGKDSGAAFGVTISDDDLPF